MLAAMVEVCSERGAANVTVAHVVARAGISRRTFYELFEDREDCFLAAFDHALEQAAAIVVPAYESQSAWREQVRAGLTALLGFLEDEPGLGALLVVDALGAGPGALARRTEVLDTLIAKLDEGPRSEQKGSSAPRKGKGTVNGASASLTAEGVVGAVFAVIHARILERQSADEGGLLPSGRGGASRSRTQEAKCARHMSDRGRRDAPPISVLLNPLMSIIVMPYLGASAARRELDRPVPEARKPRPARSNPLQHLDMRLTYRTVRVLVAIAQNPGACNRHIGEQAGVHDQGQISKLLARLEGLGLICNTGAGHNRGAPNEWTLTPQGQDVQRAIGAQGGP
jgi:AcrR family transcriptional regulator/DNA-binding MarR family transcriptional regulator